MSVVVCPPLLLLFVWFVAAMLRLILVGNKSIEINLSVEYSIPHLNRQMYHIIRCSLAIPGILNFLIGRLISLEFHTYAHVSSLCVG